MAHRNAQTHTHTMQRKREEKKEKLTSRPRSQTLQMYNDIIVTRGPKAKNSHRCCVWSKTEWLFVMWQVAAIMCVVSYSQELHDELYGKQRRITYYKQLANIRTAALSGAMTPYRSHIGSQTTLVVTSQGAVNTGYVEKY